MTCYRNRCVFAASALQRASSCLIAENRNVGLQALVIFTGWRDPSRQGNSLRTAGILRMTVTTLLAQETISNAEGRSETCETGEALDALEAFGRMLAWREDRLTLLIRLDEISRRPPPAPKPQTVTYVEEGLRRLGYCEISDLVKNDFFGALQTFSELMKASNDTEIRSLEKIYVYRKHSRMVKNVEENAEDG